MGECKNSRLRAIKLFVVCKSGGGGGGLSSPMLKFGGGPSTPCPPYFSAPVIRIGIVSRTAPVRGNASTGRYNFLMN